MLPVVFYYSQKERRLHIGEVFKRGVERHGGTVDFKLLGVEEREGPHVAAFVGAKQLSNVLPLRDRGCTLLCFDKQYPRLLANGDFHRGETYHRIGVNGAHPTDLLTRMGCPDFRRHLFDWRVSPWNRQGEYVVLIGAGPAFYNRAGVTDVMEHLAYVVACIRANTARPVQFRPKPNMAKRLSHVPGTVDLPSLTHADLKPMLQRTYTLVVEDSSTCIEGLLLGIPSIVLADAPTKPLSSTELSCVEHPWLASPTDVEYFLNDLAYFQYDDSELESGIAWDFLKKLT